MTLRRNPAICAAELDGEICLFHPDTAEYLNLNATGSAVWNLLDVPLPREQLLAQLLERYAVEEATCRSETEAFLTEALERGMLLRRSLAYGLTNELHLGMSKFSDGTPLTHF